MGNFVVRSFHSVSYTHLVIIPVVKGTYKTSALKAENSIFVKRVVGNNYATPADLSSKEVSLTFDANGSIYVYATDGKIEGEMCIRDRFFRSL